MPDDKTQPKTTAGTIDEVVRGQNAWNNAAGGIRGEVLSLDDVNREYARLSSEKRPSWLRRYGAWVLGGIAALATAGLIYFSSQEPEIVETIVEKEVPVEVEVVKEVPVVKEIKVPVHDSYVAEQTKITFSITPAELEANIECERAKIAAMLHQVEEEQGAMINGHLAKVAGQEIDLTEISEIKTETYPKSPVNIRKYQSIGQGYMWVLKDKTQKVFNPQYKLGQDDLIELLFLRDVREELGLEAKSSSEKGCILKLNPREQEARTLITDRLGCEDIAVLNNYLYCLEKDSSPSKSHRMVRVDLSKPHIESAFTRQEFDLAHLRYMWITYDYPLMVDEEQEEHLKKKMCDIKAWAREGLREVYPLSLFCENDLIGSELRKLVKDIEECQEPNAQEGMYSEMSFNLFPFLVKWQMHYSIYCYKELYKTSQKEGRRRIEDAITTRVEFDTNKVTAIDIKGEGDRATVYVTVIPDESLDEKAAVEPFHMPSASAKKLKELITSLNRSREKEEEIASGYTAKQEEEHHLEPRKLYPMPKIESPAYEGVTDRSTLANLVNHIEECSKRNQNDAFLERTIGVTRGVYEGRLSYHVLCMNELCVGSEVDRDHNLVCKEKIMDIPANLDTMMIKNLSVEIDPSQEKEGYEPMGILTVVEESYDKTKPLKTTQYHMPYGSAVELKAILDPFIGLSEKDEKKHGQGQKDAEKDRAEGFGPKKKEVAKPKIVSDSKTERYDLNNDRSETPLGVDEIFNTGFISDPNIVDDFRSEGMPTPMYASTEKDEGIEDAASLGETGELTENYFASMEDRSESRRIINELNAKQSGRVFLRERMKKTDDLEEMIRIIDGHIYGEDFIHHYRRLSRSFLKKFAFYMAKKIVANNLSREEMANELSFGFEIGQCLCYSRIFDGAGEEDLTKEFAKGCDSFGCNFSINGCKNYGCITISCKPDAQKKDITCEWIDYPD